MKLYLTLESEDGLRKSEKVMFVDETTLSRHDIYGQAIEEMYEMIIEDFDTPKVDLPEEAMNYKSYPLPDGVKDGQPY